MGSTEWLSGGRNSAKAHATAHQEDCGTITIESAISEDKVEVYSCSVGSGTIEKGDELEVSVSVTNDNDVEVDVGIDIAIDGDYEGNNLGGTMYDVGTLNVTTSTFGPISWETLKDDYGTGELTIEAKITDVGEDLP